MSAARVLTISVVVHDPPTQHHLSPLLTSSRMTDLSMELEDGELPVASVANNGPSSAAAADDQLRAQLHETTQDLRHQGQLNLARLVHALAELDLP